MAIAFARLEFAKRSEGKNACQKAAYISGSKIEFQGTKFSEPKTYNYSKKKDVVLSSVLLPEGVDEKFRKPELLWNEAEKSENRKNSVVQHETLLALPDDKEVSLEMKREMVERYVEKKYTSKGYGVHYAIHSSGPVYERNEEGGEVRVDGHNWHAHILWTPRRFNEAGDSFEKTKVRDVFTKVRFGKVVNGDELGKEWAADQNSMFIEKGLAVRVDPTGIIGQKHLGPLRFIDAASDILNANDCLSQENRIQSLNPDKAIAKLLETKACFSEEDVVRFLDKHVDAALSDSVKNEIFRSRNLVKLIDRETGKPSQLFTSKQVLEEERSILRNAERIHGKGALRNSKPHSVFISGLTEEQKSAFHGVRSGQRLSCVEGFAGTGKSRLLVALRDFYQEADYTIRAFGSDAATAQVLKDKGFQKAENLHEFLFGYKHDQRSISSGKEIWLVDESGKIGNQALSEFLKVADQKNVQLVFSGDSAQLSSVSRGGMFQTFCKEFGSHVLEDVQRQKDQQERLVSVQLAKGDVAEAVDAIEGRGGFFWSRGRVSASEDMVTKWAKDSLNHPKDSVLMIAHSNKYVRVLNEMARVVRKQQGKLGDKEFKCETSQGVLFVSEGDNIEFRKKDKKLNVVNGTRGTIVSASPKKFVVQVEEDKAVRQVTFNPTRYNYFQLGYATSHYRSQGHTVNRAYVLYSRATSKQAFYVEMTRHIDKVYCFVPKNDAKNLAALKAQVVKSSSPKTLHSYESEGEARGRELKVERSAEIQELKNSNSLWDKAKGYGLSAFETVKEKSSSKVQDVKDHTSDRSFYQFSEEKEGKAHKVENVIRRTKPPSQPPLQEKEIEPFIPKQNHWKDLNAQQKESLKSYFSSCRDAFDLYQVVQSESESRGCQHKDAPTFSKWQRACGERNELSHSLLGVVGKTSLETALGSKSSQIISQQASRFEQSRQAYESKKIDFDSCLKANIEPLLYRLFPDGHSQKDRNNIRYGSKGSLSVSIDGSKAGTFYDFEEGKGGGLFQLIQYRLDLSPKEAAVWTREFLGEAPTISVPKDYSTELSTKPESNWTSLQPPEDRPAPSIDKISKIGHYRNEAARYAYRSLEGQPLFYTVRLESKSNPKDKQVLPLSYGYVGEGNAPSWRLKAYAPSNRPLYGQHLLREHPKAKVLIVEGEKSADAANKMFADRGYIALSWMGGAGTVSKSDWSPLARRNSLIWPDNDRAGEKAANQVVGELRKVGCSSIKLVGMDSLRKSFPEKWDLADPLPEGVRPDVPLVLLQVAEERAVSISRVLSDLTAHNRSIDRKNAAHVSLVQDVVSRISIREGAELVKGGDIISEAVEVLKDYKGFNGEPKESTLTTLDFNDELSRRSLLYRADTGTLPSDGSLEQIKSEIRKSKEIVRPDVQLAQVAIQPEDTRQRQVGMER